MQKWIVILEAGGSCFAVQSFKTKVEARVWIAAQSTALFTYSVRLVG
jgi:hypothetical protein